MKKNFLKPFAVTVGTLLTVAPASASINQVDAQSAALIADSVDKLSGADVILENSDEAVQFATHGSHSSHSSHASHASHSSHASSAY